MTLSSGTCQFCGGDSVTCPGYRPARAVSLPGYLAGRIREGMADVALLRGCLDDRTEDDGPTVPWQVAEHARLDRDVHRLQVYRRIVEAHSGTWDEACDSDDQDGCETMLLLAQLWADRPDFPNEWRR